MHSQWGNVALKGVKIGSWERGCKNTTLFIYKIQTIPTYRQYLNKYTVCLWYQNFMEGILRKTCLKSLLRGAIIF